MILSLIMPRIGAQAQQVSVHKIIASPGDELRPGTPLLEIRVDIGSAKAQDCLPLSFFRIIATERAHLRSFGVAQGGLLASGVPLGLASTDRTESLDNTPTRPLRLTSVAIQIDPLSR